MGTMQRIFSPLGMRNIGSYTWPFEVCVFVCDRQRNREKASWFVISTVLLNKLIKSCGDNTVILYVAGVASEIEKEGNGQDTAIAVR